MADELSTEHRLALATEAARLYDDLMFNAVLTSITKDHINGLISSDIGSEIAKCHQAGLQALKDIKERLNAMKGDGAVLRKQLKAEQPRDR